VLILIKHHDSSTYSKAMPQNIPYFYTEKKMAQL
jgi:hypothetical protein